MSLDEECCAMVYTGGTFRGHVCGRRAKVVRDGKHYCGTHDPERLKAVRDANSAKWQAKRDAARKANDEAWMRREVMEKDAARYRWFRDQWINEDGVPEEIMYVQTAGEMDDVIDAVIKEKSK
jgi:hypothetical protein